MSLIPIKTINDAYAAGYDCGKNGSNTTNCHFAFFSSPHMTKSWEQGKRQAEYDQENPNPLYDSDPIECRGH